MNEEMQKLLDRIKELEASIAQAEPNVVCMTMFLRDKKALSEAKLKLQQMQKQSPN
jgi:hypothetical protein